MKARRWAGWLAVAGCLVGVAGLPTPARAGADEPVPVGCERLGVIGDSLTYLGAFKTAQELVEVGFTDVRIDARIARRTLVGLRTVKSGVSALRQMRASGYAPDCLVIALGTNDLRASTDVAFREIIDGLLAEIGAEPRVLWVNVFARHAPTLSRNFNAVLVDVASQRSNLWIADWLTSVQKHGNWLHRDGIHATGSGSRGRARLVAAAAHAAFVGGQPASPPAGCSVSTVPLKVRMTGIDVRCLESRLHQLRYQRATPDDRFGATTREALLAWQTLHGLASSGALDTPTRTALGLTPPG